MKNTRFFFNLILFSFLVVTFSVYMNRDVSLMSVWASVPRKSVLREYGISWASMILCELNGIFTLLDLRGYIYKHRELLL